MVLLLHPGRYIVKMYNVVDTVCANLETAAFNFDELPTPGVLAWNARNNGISMNSQ